MGTSVDLETLLDPISPENPAGEDLRYTQAYEDIKEARREEDAFAQGDWQREVKVADWDRVLKLSAEALTGKTKDFQVAAWMTEALTMTEGFSGLACGLRTMTGLLSGFWDSAYPLVEEGDIEYRLAPFEFLNDRLSSRMKDLPLTAAGHSFLKMQESREVGYEADIRNRYGDIDEQKRQRRDELIAEGKITAEAFDAAVAQTPVSFYKSLAEDLASCQEAFKAIDGAVDEKFGKGYGPRISDLGQAIEECTRVVTKIYKEKAPTAEAAPTPKTDLSKPAKEAAAAPAATSAPEAVAPVAARPAAVPTAPDAASLETALWDEAVRTVESGDIRAALDRLLTVSYGAASERERYRCRLLVAKLCLKAGRADLARPIVEELHALIEELHLQRWESPLWIAEVLEALYQCLTAGEPPDEDLGRANELFKRICAMDVTKAILYKR